VLFFKTLHGLVHLLAGHRQKRFLQSQLYVGIGQDSFGELQLSAQPGSLTNLVGLFHANDFTIVTAAQLPHPASNRAVPFNALFAFYGPSTVLPGFHFPDSLHFECLTIANYSHDTSSF
jgi:hypothetical protein